MIESRIARFLAALPFLLSLTLPLAAQPATLVKDLNSSRSYGIWEWPFFPQVVNLQGTALFQVNDGRHGTELWRSDGTEAGTSLLRDICPGACSPWIWQPVVVGGIAYFSADDGAHGRELWKTDGTSAGTVLVADLVPGLVGSSPFPIAEVGGKLLFVSHDGGAGSGELWVSDGTAAGTTLLADIEPGPGSSSPVLLGKIGGVALFSAATSALGRELWRTDGTPAGTFLVKDMAPGAVGSIQREEVVLPRAAYAAVSGARLFFQADDGVHGTELWVSDGTAAGTEMVSDINPASGISGSSIPQSIVAFGSGVLFRADDGSHGAEPWISDGTAAGTSLLKDIYTGSAGSGPWDFLVSGGRAYFTAGDDTHGRELWTSDGTAAGTTLVADLNPGAGSGTPFGLPPAGFIGSDLLFYADDGIHGSELWKSDGTAAGTVAVADINPGAQSSYFLNGGIDGTQTLVLAGRLLFVAYSANDAFQIWSSDGTPAGTHELKQINDQTAAFVPIFWGTLFGPRPFGDLAGTLLFGGDDGSARFELHKSDGTAAGTVPVSDGAPGTFVSSPRGFTPLGGALLFGGEDGVHGSQLWRTDGTPAGTFLVRELDPVNNGSNELPRWLTPLGARIVLAGPDSAIWTSDGTTAGTQRLGGGLRMYGPPAPLGGVLLFPGTDGSNDGLWRTDGSLAGTIRILAISPSGLVSAGGQVYFSAYSASTGVELWKSDGTVAGTSLVKDIRPGSADGVEAAYANDDVDLGRSWAALGSRVVFPADDGVIGKEPWVSDGTAAGTFPLGDLFAGSRGSEPLWFTSAAGTVFFVADDGVHGRELWTTDGTPAGTSLLLDIEPGAGSALPTELRAVGRLLLFSAWDSLHGREPWVSDGTAAGTHRVQDIAPGALSSSPMGFLASGSRIYFVANDNTTGFELWSLPKSALGAALSASKTVSGFFYEGGTVTYQIEVRNDGPTLQPDAPGAELTDVLPAGLALTGATSTSGSATIDSGTRTVTWNGSLPSGATATITITATIQAGTIGTTLSNQATLAWDADGDGANEASGVSDDPTAGGGSDPTPVTVGAEALGFYTVTPCRIADTRSTTPLANGVAKTFQVAGTCGIPSTARAVAANLTAVGATAMGTVVVWQNGALAPGTSNLNVRVGAIRGNNALLELGAGGAIDAQATINGGGTVNLVVDVSGYFQ